MKAVMCREFGPLDNLRIEDLPDPVAGEGQVLIDIEAAGVNFPDGLIVGGGYQVKPELPFIPGGEAAGIVSAVGPGVTTLKVGQRVIALCALGGFAEKVVINAAQAVAVPASLDAKAAAGFAVVYGTSIHGLQDKANLKAGETLLVLGAAGGVGMASLQVGKAMGAKVIAAASTDEKVALALENGADFGINYTTTDLKSELRKLAPKGVDVIVDPVGGPLTEPAVRNLAWGGRLLVIGFAEGNIPKLPLNLLLLKEAAAIGVFWGQFLQRSPDHHLANIKQLLDWFVAGKLKPYVSESYPLEQVKEALQVVMERRARGKVVITTQA